MKRLEPYPTTRQYLLYSGVAFVVVAAGLAFLGLPIALGFLALGIFNVWMAFEGFVLLAGWFDRRMRGKRG